MKITGTAIKLGAFSAVVLMFTAIIIVVFGQVRFERTVEYSAIVGDTSGLRAGQFVRASGVEVGKVVKVEPIDDATRARIDFNVDKNLPLYQDTSASIRYLNLIGDHYLEITRGDSDKQLPPGSTIPIGRTHPALDLDALLGGFRPLFRALDPEKVNTIAKSLITVLQGEGGTINDILDQTAQFTSTLADRDQAIGQVINNLNTVLGTAVKHQKQFDETVTNFEALITALKNRADPLADSIANISNAAGTLANLLTKNRSWVRDALRDLEITVAPLVEKKDEINDTLRKLPDTFKLIGRAGSFGDFFNIYICNASILVNGLQPGGPVRTVKLIGQPSGRCTPQ